MFNKAIIAEQVRSEYRLEGLKGNVPGKWPEGVR